MQVEEYALKLSAGDFASRPKTKAKPQRRDSASWSTRTFPIGEGTWTDVEPGEYSISDCAVLKKLILLRHGNLPRENDGAIEFWLLRFPCEQNFKGLQSGSIPFGMNPICQRVTNLSEFIAKQVPCQSDLFLKHEANVQTLLLDIRMMVFLMQLTVPSAAPIQLSKCVNPDQLKTERLETICANMERVGWPTQTSLPWWRWRRCIHHPSARRSLTNPQHQRSQKRNVFKLAPLGSGQTFTLVAPVLSVPGISPEVLQRVLSQANRPHVWWPPPRLPAFSPPGGSRRFFL